MNYVDDNDNNTTTTTTTTTTTNTTTNNNDNRDGQLADVLCEQKLFKQTPYSFFEILLFGEPGVRIKPLTKPPTKPPTGPPTKPPTKTRGKS